jgi:hypothetical protein
MLEKRKSQALQETPPASIQVWQNIVRCGIGVKGDRSAFWPGCENSQKVRLKKTSIGVSIPVSTSVINYRKIDFAAYP